MSPLSPARRRAAAAVAAAALGALPALAGLGGCARAPAEPVAFGGPCTSDDACASGVCVGGVAGDAARCTSFCASDDDCPDGWSCGAVTASQRVVCQRGPSSPLGPAPR